MTATTHRWRRLAWSSGVLALSVALVGWAHTRSGRPLMQLMQRATGESCPLGYDRTRTPAEREAAMRAFSASHAGATMPAARPALGFSLEHDTRADVMTWAKAHNVECQPSRSADLECHSTLGTIWLDFGERDQLLSVVAIERDRSAERISAHFAAATALLDHDAGPATQRTGNAAPTALASGLLHAASAEYRYATYYAVVRATNLGNTFMLTQEYRALLGR